jgi:hypothetical protein
MTANFVEGVVSAAPATAADLVGVAGLAGQQLAVTPWWTPRGSQLPHVGDPCRLLIPSSGLPVIVSWRRASEL